MKQDQTLPPGKEGASLRPRKLSPDGRGTSEHAADGRRRSFLARMAASVLVGLSPSTGLAGATRPKPRPSSLAPTYSASRGSHADSPLAGSPLEKKTACLAVDMKDGKVIFAHQAELLLPPASVTKILTALYALETLGPDYRFATRLRVTGPIENGILKGDLILEGGGDPTLDSRGLSELALRLAKAGIREVRGGFLVADGALPRLKALAPHQPSHAAYNPGLSGLNLNFNRVHFAWERTPGGYLLTLDARSGPLRPGVQTITIRAARRKSPVYRYRITGGIEEWTVARSALGQRGSRWLPVRRPAFYAGDVFRTLARSRGIILPAAQRIEAPLAKARILVAIESEPLERILRGMLYYSTNLTAEAVGLMATRKRLGKTPPDLATSAAEMSRWAHSRFGLGRSSLADHSGLHDTTRLSPRDLMQVLRDTEVHSRLSLLLKRIDLGRFGGAKAGKPPQKGGLHILAKTGTLNFVSALAGYAELDRGRSVAFVIQSADISRRASLPPDLESRPAGARSWRGMARTLQRRLVLEWARQLSGDRG